MKTACVLCTVIELTCFVDFQIVKRSLVVRSGGEGTAGKVDMVGGAEDKNTLTATIMKVLKC